MHIKCLLPLPKISLNCHLFHASFSFLFLQHDISHSAMWLQTHPGMCMFHCPKIEKMSWNVLFRTVLDVQYVLLQKPSLAFHILRKIQYIKDNVILCVYWQVHGKIDESHSVLSFPDDNVLVSSNVAQLVAVKIHHEFAQAGLSGSEVDFDFGLLPGFDGWLQSETN